MATPAPPAVTQQQGQQQPPKEKGICRYFKQGKCKHTNQGGDTCEFKHPEVCKIFLLAGNSEKGCQDDACKELHPNLCVASGSRVGGQAHVATRSARKSILMFPKISQMLTRVCQKICNLLPLSNQSTDHLLQIEREGQPPGMHQLGEKAWNLTCSLHIISRLILRKESKPCKTQ